MKNLILISTVCFLPLITLALEKKTQYWGSLSFNKAIAEKWAASAELIERHSVDQGESVVRSIRLGAGYKFENGITYVLHLENRKTDRTPNDEKRVIHQFSKKWKFEPVNLAFRLRQEQRKFENSEVWMNRTRIQAKVEINDWSTDQLTPYISSEYFYISNTVASRQAGSAETRLQLGSAYKATENLALDLSYMDRRTYAEKTSVTSRKETFYQVVLLSAKYQF